MLSSNLELVSRSDSVKVRQFLEITIFLLVILLPGQFSLRLNYFLESDSS
jgi:hypothetical protein